MQPSYKLTAIWRARLALLFLLILIPLCLLRPLYPAAGALSITVLTGLCLMAWALIPRYCRRLRYRVDQTGISVSSGLFFTRLLHLSQPGALYACVYRTPFYLPAGLYGIALWGAGVHALLPGLSQEQVQAVLSLLSQSGKGGGAL